MRTVVALYDRFEDAQQVVQSLHDIGFDRGDINMIARDSSGEYSRYFDQGNKDVVAHDEASDGAAKGAGVGAVLGGLGGLLVGLGALAIPGIGPVIAAGPIITTLAGAGIGAVAGGIVGALVDLGIPKEHAEYFAEGIRRGGTLVVVRADDPRAEQARSVMNRFNPVDIDTRSQAWRQNAWNGFDQSSQPLTGDQMEFNRSRAHTPMTSSDVNPVSNQDVSPNLDRDVERGLGRDLDADVHTHKIDVDNMNAEGIGSVPMGGSDRDMDQNDPYLIDRVDRDMKEDIYSNERVNETNMADIPVTGGPMEVEEVDEVLIFPIDQEGWNDYLPEYRRDYQTRYGSTGHGYAYYSPAYQYGYYLASDPQYQAYEWDRMEPMAQKEWQRRGIPGAWEDVKDAIHHAWDSVRRRV